MKKETAKQVIYNLDYEITNFNNIIQILLSAFRNAKDDSKTPNQVITLLEVLEEKTKLFNNQIMTLLDLVTGVF